MINCLLITICWVVILDQLTFWDDFSSQIKSLITGGRFKSPIELKPFNCSVCMSFWCNLVYIIVTGNFTVFMVGYILLLSWSTPIMNSILSFVRNAVIKFINTIAEKINI